MASKKALIIGSGIFLVGLILDQLTKFFALQLTVPRDVGFFSLTLTYNTGSLFSLFAQASFANTMFIIITFLVLGTLLYVLRKEQHYYPYLAMILAGGIGNLIDRFRFGAVVDFINLGWWPIFNIADALLVCGVILLAIHIAFEKEKKEKK